MICKDSVGVSKANFTNKPNFTSHGNSGHTGLGYFQLQDHRKVPQTLISRSASSDVSNWKFSHGRNTNPPLVGARSAAFFALPLRKLSEFGITIIQSCARRQATIIATRSHCE